MRLNKLLKKLDVRLEDLKTLEPKLDFKIERATQKLTQDQVNKIILASKARELEGGYDNKFIYTSIKIELDEKYEEQDGEKKYYKIPSDSRTEIILAKVKWYYNRNTGGEYGFLESDKLGDIHFNGGCVYGEDPHQLSENQNVIVAVNKRANRDKLSAKSVHTVDCVDDINALVKCLDAERYVRHDIVLDQIINIFDDENESHISSLKEFVQNTSQDFSDSKEALIKVLKVLPLLEFKCDISAFSEATLFEGWTIGYEGIPYRAIDKVAIQYFKENIQELNSSKGFSNLKFEDKQQFITDLLDKLLASKESSSKGDFISLFSVANKYEILLPTEAFSNHFKYELWEKGLIDDVPYDVFLFKILEDYELDTRGTVLNYKIPEENIKNELAKQDVQKLSEQQLKEFLGFVSYKFEDFDEESAFKTFRIIWELLIDNDLKTYLTEEYLKHTDGYYKVKLFVGDYTWDLNFNDAILYTHLLNTEEQVVLFKKCVALKENKDLNINLNQISKIATRDYELSKASESIDGIHIDYTLSVIVEILKIMQAGNKVTLGSIFEHVANIINDPKDIIRLKGFFDKCEGRTLLSRDITIEVDDDEKQVPVYRKELREKYKPRFATYCDGRRALDRTNNEPLKCQKSGFDFWWCENNVCYEPCRKPHSTENWKEYSLQDLFRIFEIHYSERQYERLIGIVNKANKFFEHLNCRDCGQILRPSKMDNYGFYRVSNFSCKNEDCNEFGENIYLSHCLNGSCMDIVDSRDSAKCKHNDFDQNYGWYVCKHCYACCSSEKLRARKSNLERFGKQYNGPTKGHKDQQLICCPDCGNQMKTEQLGGEIYQKQLNWFKNQKDIHPNITNYGERRDGKMWFIWDSGDYSEEQYRRQLKNMRRAGFQIPEYADTTNFSQLVSEPYDNFSGISNYHCAGCNHQLILNDNELIDAVRKNAILKYHYPNLRETQTN